ncbi:MAG: CRP-like cAMP-binding protein [Aureispira sp.]|jgi:CRP-like cAMP-binding protein
MSARLQKLVAQFAHISQEDWDFALSKAKLITLKKGEHWVQEGKTCQHIGFVITGVFRVFSTVDGKEIIAHFAFERRNPVLSAYTSFINQMPSLESIQALEDSSLLILHHEHLQKLYQEKPVFERLGRLLIEQMYVLAKTRIYDLQHKTATERYAELLEKYPQIINRIAHHHVASYLGIAPESLSRLRKKLQQG